jgi:replicative DNA helicase
VSHPDRPPVGPPFDWPANLDAEADLIGVATRDPDRLARLAGFLRPEHFFSPLHAACWRVVLDRLRAGKGTDEGTLFAGLIGAGVAGPDDHEMIGAVFARAGSGAFWDENAAIVLDLAAKRSLMEASEEVTRAASAGRSEPAAALIARWRGRIADAEAIVRPPAADEPTALADVMLEAMDRIDRRAAGESTGVTTGLADLDEFLTGLAPGSLNLIAARPSIGKSAMAFGMAYHAATTGTPVLVVSLEMPRVDVAERLLVMLAEVDGQRVRKGRLSAEEMARLGHVCGRARALGRVWIAEREVRSPEGIAAAARRYHADCGIGLLVVDYLQLVETAGEVPARASRQEQVAHVGRRLKRLAVDLDVPVLALAQLNRQPEQREDKRPRLAELRDSGTLEQDADVVLLLHRPDAYQPADRPGFAELIVAKNRNGPTGAVPLTFRHALARFDNHSGDVPPEAPDLDDDGESEAIF